MAKRPTTFDNVQILGDLTVKGSSTVTGSTISSGTINESITLATAKTATFTDADSVTIGGVIVPQRFRVEFNLPGTMPATAANYGVFFTADVAYEVTSAIERHETAGNNGSAVTIMLTKVASGTAKSAGTDCLSAGISLKGTADTNASGTLHATPANYRLAAGDSLAWVLTGTPTTCAGLSATVTLKRI